MYRKIVGVAFVVIGLAGLALSVAGTFMSQQIIDDLGGTAKNALGLIGESLDTVYDTLILTKQTVGEVSEGLDTVGVAAVNLSDTINNTQPVLEQVTQVAARDVPGSLETVQAAIPNVAQAAGAIDDTLNILNAFQVERSIFGIPIQFDLGIDYDPESPLSETVLELGQGLEELPAGLRALEDDLSSANESLLAIGDDVQTIAKDLERVNSSVGELEPLLDEYIRLAAESADLTRQTQATLSRQLQSAKLITTLLFVWLGLSQLVPFYLATELLGSHERKSAESSE